MQIDPTTEAGSPKRRSRGVPKGAVVLLPLMFVVVLFLRHDWWYWRTPGYLLFGFLPVGLWWQVGVSVLAAALMWLLVRFAWPEHLEDAGTGIRPPERAN